MLAPTCTPICEICTLKWSLKVSRILEKLRSFCQLSDTWRLGFGWVSAPEHSVRHRHRSSSWTHVQHTQTNWLCLRVEIISRGTVPYHYGETAPVLALTQLHVARNTWVTPANFASIPFLTPKVWQSGRARRKLLEPTQSHNRLQDSQTALSLMLTA